MKLIKNIFIVVFMIYAGSAQCGLFSFTPKNKISTKIDGDSITNKYACKDNINKDFLNIIFNDLVVFSKLNNIKPPQKNLCQYKIFESVMFGKKVESFGVDFYVTKSDMLSDTPDYFRGVTFKLVREKIGKYYNLVENHQNSETFHYCITFEGELVDNKEC